MPSSRVKEADQIACITANESLVGTAERLSLPAATFDFLADTDDPMESMALIASDYVANFEVDREASCPDLGFRTIGPDPVAVAGSPGLRFGFFQTRDQEVVEKNLIYGIRVGEKVHLLNFSAASDGSCVGVEGLNPRVLDHIAPELDAAIAAVILDT